MINAEKQQGRRKKTVPAAIGLLAGFLNGLFGSGGGAVIVPAVQRFMGIKAHEAHAGAVAVVLPMTLVSAAIYAFRTKPEISPVVAVSLGGMVGGLIGAKLLFKIPPKFLRKIFGLFIIAGAVRMIL